MWDVGWSGDIYGGSSPIGRIQLVGQLITPVVYFGTTYTHTAMIKWNFGKGINFMNLDLGFGLIGPFIPIDPFTSSYPGAYPVLAD